MLLYFSRADSNISAHNSNIDGRYSSPGGIHFDSKNESVSLDDKMMAEDLPAEDAPNTLKARPSRRWSQLPTQEETMLDNTNLQQIDRRFARMACSSSSSRDITISLKYAPALPRSSTSVPTETDEKSIY